MNLATCAACCLPNPLHETTRAYALEKLSESGELGDVARRHADYCRDRLERAEAEAETFPAPAWLAVYGHQIGQVRAALDWAFSPTGFAELGVALTVAAADTSDLVPGAALPLALYCDTRRGQRHLEDHLY